MTTAGFATGFGASQARRRGLDIRQQQADTERTRITNANNLARIQARIEQTAPILEQLAAHIATTAPGSPERQRIVESATVQSMVKIFTNDNVALGGSQGIGAALLDGLTNIPQTQEKAITLSPGEQAFRGGEQIAAAPTAREQNVAAATKALGPLIPAQTAAGLGVAPTSAATSAFAEKKVAFEAAKGSKATTTELLQIMGVNIATQRPRTISKNQQESILGALRLKVLVGTMRGTVGATGVVRGFGSEAAAFLGVPGDASEFKAASDESKVAIQALIKGVPSNFDVKSFVKIIPELTKAEGRNELLLDQMDNTIDALLSGTVAFHRFSKTPIPDEIISLIEESGIDINQIQPFDGTGDPLQQAIDIFQTADTRITDALDFENMTADQLDDVDVGSLSDNERRQFLDRLRQ